MTHQLLIALTIARDEYKVYPRLVQSASGLADSFGVVYNDEPNSGTYCKTITDLGCHGRQQYRAWTNFGEYRTWALGWAKRWATWALFLDADMTVHVNDAQAFRTWLQEGATAPGYMVELRDGDLAYHLPLLLRTDVYWAWEGTTHEALAGSGNLPIVSGIHVVHHNDGANRITKFKRDLGLLEPGYLSGDPRATYYYAQSLKCLGRLEEASSAYYQRACMRNGWEEERWHALYQAGACLLDINPKQAAEWLMLAHIQRPHRAEPLAALQRWCEDHRARPWPDGDRLFIEPDLYEKD